MNIQQLEYIIAVDLHRHFGRAAAACHVTQPTLSMMVRKLEEELGVHLFDRRRKPVVPTETGALIIAQARSVLREARQINEIVARRRAVPEGTLQVGIIPTLAPYLVPLFIKSFLHQYPGIQLRIAEHTTDVLLELLRKGSLDAGVLVTPLEIPAFEETPLFCEAFVVYSSHPWEKERIHPTEIDTGGLWLLEEGHCFRSQILNLCDLRRRGGMQLAYAAGSIETLIRLVDSQQGITVLPELAALGLSRERRRRLVRFTEPEPVREVSLVTVRSQGRRHLVDLLHQEILRHLPQEVREHHGRQRVPLTP